MTFLKETWTLLVPTTLTLLFACTTKETVYVNQQDSSANEIPGTFSEGPNLGLGRSEHASVVLADGTVLVTGGLNSFDSAEIYDPSTSKIDFAAWLISTTF